MAQTSSPTAIPIWQLPQPYQLSPQPPSWVVVFLCNVDDENYDRILTTLCTLDRTWKDAPPGQMRRLLPVPWIRDFIPPISVIFDIFEQTKYTDGLIFVDGQSLDDNTVVILNGYYGPESVEAARIRMDRANLTLDASQGRSLAAVMPGFEETRILPDKCPEDELGGQCKMAYRLPPHIPADFQPAQATLTLISMVHLSEEDINAILSQPWESKRVENVEILNWPADKQPCSRAEVFRIFQAVKTPRSHDIDQASAMFIDLPDEDHGPRIIVAQESRKDEQRSTNIIHLSGLEHLKDAVEVWHMIWNPFVKHPKSGRVWSNGFVVNPSLFYSNKLNSEFEKISNPDEIVLADDACFVFVLEKLDEREVMNMCSGLLSELEQSAQLVDVSHFIKTPDVEGLVALFESREFTQSGQELPWCFFAVDRHSLNVASGEDEEAPCFITAGRKNLHISVEKPDHERFRDGDELYGCQCLGYYYARMDVDGAAEAWTSMDLGDTHSLESTEDIQTAYFSFVRRWAEDKDWLEGGNEFQPAFDPR